MCIGLSVLLLLLLAGYSAARSDTNSDILGTWQAFKIGANPPITVIFGARQSAVYVHPAGENLQGSFIQSLRVENQDVSFSYNIQGVDWLAYCELGVKSAALILECTMRTAQIALLYHFHKIREH